MKAAVAAVAAAEAAVVAAAAVTAVARLPVFPLSIIILLSSSFRMSRCRWKSNSSPPPSTKLQREENGSN